MSNELATDLTADEYDRIAREIESSDSPVGIDAKKAHVLILHKLMALERRLDRLEAKLDATGD
ncbi:MAG: hypothetical protein GVY35_00070 [Bacteroidetes bacterium]|jgi:hypothetical protein|nr:hypothetical protein [Bacteroidota bacterium]